MSARDTFPQLIREFAKPVLARHGFRARGRTFFKLSHDNWALVTFQVHRLSSPVKLLFTINLAVASARLSQAPPEQWRKGPPPEYACDLRMRLGLLLPGAQDKWWTIDSETDIRDLAGDVFQALESVGLPTLERYTPDEALRDLWLSGGGWLTRPERTQKLTALLRLIGPADVLQRTEAAVSSSASLEAGEAEIKDVLLQAGFRPVGDGTFVVPTSDDKLDGPP